MDRKVWKRTLWGVVLQPDRNHQITFFGFLKSRRTKISCANESLHKPILLAVESLVQEEKNSFGHDCINKFCGDVFSGTVCVRKTELFFAHFGSGFYFLPILEWLYRQLEYIPKILLRENKVVSMRVGNKRFTDSYFFIPIPLSKFTSTFNLKERAKG